MWREKDKPYRTSWVYDDAANVLDEFFDDGSAYWELGSGLHKFSLQL